MDVSCYALGTTAIITFSSEWFLDYQDNCQKLQHPMQFKTEGLKEKVLQIFPSQQSIYSQRFKWMKILFWLQFGFKHLEQFLWCKPRVARHQHNLFPRMYLYQWSCKIDQCRRCHSPWKVKAFIIHQVNSSHQSNISVLETFKYPPFSSWKKTNNCSLLLLKVYYSQSWDSKY